jgi:hypothetical protein
MKELLRTNDPVRLSWLQALLRDSGIDSFVLDHHTSLVEGNIGAIPRRLMVAERDYRRACALLAVSEEVADGSTGRAAREQPPQSSRRTPGGRPA